MINELGRMVRLGAALAAMIVAAFPAQAAPSAAGDDPGFVDSGLTTVAPVTGRGFFIRPSLRTRYDTNMLRLGDGFTPTNGGQREDLQISPLVTASLGLPVGRQQVFVTGSLGRDIYINNEQLNRNRYSLGAGVNLRAASRCTATAAVNFDSRQALVTEVAELVPNLQETLSYGATALCQSPAGLGFGGTVRRIEFRNDTATRRPLDYNSLIFSGQLNYALGNIGRFSASGTLTQIQYMNRPVILPTGNVDTDAVDILSGRFGFQREIGSRLSLNLGLSYLETRPVPPTILQLTPTVPPAAPGQFLAPIDREKFSGLGYDAAITYRPSTRLTATFQASRNVQASANVLAQYQVFTSLVGDVDYRLGSAITIGGGATFDKRQYFNNALFTTAGGRRVEDDISRVYGNIGYTPVKLYTVGLELAYQNRKSLPVEFSFDSFSAVLSLRVNFGRES
jgi:hypothetical protein